MNIDFTNNKIIVSLLGLYTIINVGLFFSVLNLQIGTFTDFITLTLFSMLGGAFFSMITMLILAKPNTQDISEATSL